MRIEEAYNNWADSYDKVENLTRSLDEKVVRLILSDIKDKEIVEAGCGTGKNSIWFAESCKNLIAFDLSTEMLRIAKEKVTKTNSKFLIHNITKPWPFEDESCDLVSINLILEHIKNINFVLTEAYRILRKKGQLFVCELHPSKQKEGSVARFIDKTTEEEIRLISYYHSKYDFSNAGKTAGFNKIKMDEWFDDQNKDIPRLLSILLTK